MQVSGLGSDSSSLASVNPYAGQELDQAAFMELLVTQLENQDPLEPMNNENFIAQLASFSSLEQLESLNGNIMAMIALNQSNALLAQMTQGSALIGKQVSWIDPVSGASSIGTVDSVKIEQGIAFLSIDGEAVPMVNVTEILGDAPSTGEETDGE
jgi:flagellar basal-body rod modification protein FlgD